MESLGAGGMVVAVLGLAVTIVGLITIIWRVRDDRRRTAGLRVQYVGMAVVNLGLSLFMLSSPAEILPSPLIFSSQSCSLRCPFESLVRRRS